MRGLFCIAILILAFAFSASAQQQAPAQTVAQTPTQTPAALQPPPRFLAKDLQALCEGADGSTRLAGCLRYLQGAVALYELAVADGKDLTWFCAPREAPASMLRQQFVEWARDNADQMNADAIQAVRLALADAYPCQGD